MSKTSRKCGTKCTSLILCRKPIEVHPLKVNETKITSEKDVNWDHFGIEDNDESNKDRKTGVFTVSWSVI